MILSKSYERSVWTHFIKTSGKEPGTDYDNAFLKSYDGAGGWLNEY
jgi:hypothetical protein